MPVLSFQSHPFHNLVSSLSSPLIAYLPLALSLNVCPWGSLVEKGKVSSQGGMERCSIWVGSCFVCKNKNTVEVNDSDKHSSLLKYRINYDGKKFYNTGQGCLFKATPFINWYRVSPPISMLISHWHYH